MIVYNSENSIRIFTIQGYFVFHCFVTECWETYFISLKVVTRIEALLTKYYCNLPLTLYPGVKMGICPFLEIGTKN